MGLNDRLQHAWDAFMNKDPTTSMLNGNKEVSMLKHHITKYTSDGIRYAESWIQLNLFGKCLCFFKKRITI